MENNFVPLSDPRVFKHLFGTDKNIRFTKNLLSVFLDVDETYFDGMEIINEENVSMKSIPKKDFDPEIIVKLKNDRIINISIDDKVLQIKYVFDIN